MRRLLAAGLLSGVLSCPAPAEAATSYATCYSLSGRAADGVGVYSGMVAHNYLRAGTRITILTPAVKRFFGTDRFTVHDTGPALADGHFDLWAPGGCLSWGKRTIRYRIGWRKPVGFGRRVGRVKGPTRIPYGPWARTVRLPL